MGISFANHVALGDGALDGRRPVADACLLQKLDHTRIHDVVFGGDHVVAAVWDELALEVGNQPTGAFEGAHRIGDDLPVADEE